MKYHTKVFLAMCTLLILTFNSNSVFADSNTQNSYRIESNKFVSNNKEDKSEPKEVLSITNDELYLLSKLVSSEARGEEYEGQVAVAAVVIWQARRCSTPLPGLCLCWRWCRECRICRLPDRCVFSRCCQWDCRC